MKLTDKGVIKYGLYHMLLQQLFEVLTDKADRLDMIKQIQHILVEILHTKEGMQVALQCIWHSGAKERKAIAKSFKQFITKIATDDQGHKVSTNVACQQHSSESCTAPNGCEFRKETSLSWAFLAGSDGIVRCDRRHCHAKSDRDLRTREEPERAIEEQVRSESVRLLDDGKEPLRNNT